MSPIKKSILQTTSLLNSNIKTPFCKHSKPTETRTSNFPASQDGNGNPDSAYQAGTQLPNIIGYQFFVCYVIFSGTGVTVGLALLMAFRAKSKQYKTLGMLVLPTSIFNINEPILFGTPIVLNPFMLLPYLLTPILTSTIAYVVTAIGLVPRLSSVQIPWTTPIIASGILEGGWKIAVLQVVLVVVSVAVYYIPFKYLDNKAYEQEYTGDSADTAAA